jgi:alpha-ribazole phosphatase
MEPSKSRSVYLIRHGEAVWPGGGHRFLGQADPPISTAGRAQVRSLAQRLEGVKFEAVYSSDLERCLRTAEALREGTDTPIFEEPDLREIDVGRWEGLTMEDVKRLYPLECAERERDLVGYPFPGGESFRDVERRAVPILERIIDLSAENVLVVGHKGVNRVLLCHLRALPLGDLFSLSQDFCSLHVIQISDLPDGDRRIVVQHPLHTRAQRTDAAHLRR